MKKSKGIIVLIIMLLILGGLAYTAVFGLGENKSGSASNIKRGLDIAGGVSITYQVDGEEEPSIEDMADTIYKLQQRVQAYSTEANVYQEGTDRINIEIPGVSDANAVLEELGKPGSLYFLKADGTVVIEGTDVISAKAVISEDQLGNKDNQVQLTITDEGAVSFQAATEEAVVSGDPIYIVYDDKTISNPTVEEVIAGTVVYISHMESFEAAEKLASQIRIGGLKLELTELRSNVVGAQLGETAIKTSLIAGLIGLIIVILMMVFFYRIPGIASSIALLLYVGIMSLLLNGFSVTLTLPGIAGIILSIGMAVDANVIIFARIKEEIATGKTVKSAIDIGFKKARSAILDGNITTLIAAAVLGFMGTGSVKGFASTLAIGIVLSMFTALFLTKQILNALYSLGVTGEKFYGKAKERKSVNFLSKKGIFFGASIAVILAGFLAMGVYKVNSGDILNYNLEFKGGTSMSVTFNEDYSLAQLESDVLPVITEIAGSDVHPQKVSGSNEVIFKTRALTVAEREAINTALAENFDVAEESIVTETISSTISGEMKRDAIIAVLVSAICMLIYIWFRFKDIRFATSSVLALIHDVLVVLAFYAIARVSVGNTFIACMLTIIGYSINATIVIFDRVRENRTLALRTDTMGDVVNKSITQTLSRSIFTSLTTFVMVAVLYVMGVTSIKEFALPLMVGIACGTYSSVCLAASMWFVMHKKAERLKA